MTEIAGIYFIAHGNNVLAISKKSVLELEFSDPGSSTTASRKHKRDFKFLICVATPPM